MAFLEKLTELIDYTPKDPKWFELAMTHKSFDKTQGDNERLEFIGDAVVDLVVADLLFDFFPEDDEGPLSRKRASLVNEECLSNLAMRLRLDEVLRVSTNENESALRTNKRLLAGSLEALIGAIYKDGGFAAAYEWVRKLYQELSGRDLAHFDFEKDYKTRFQEIIQEQRKITPAYQLAGISGPDHQRVFTVQVLVEGEIFGEGSGESKKVAAQLAAKSALQRMGYGV